MLFIGFLLANSAFSQSDAAHFGTYIGKADSSYKVKNYTLAGQYADKFMQIDSTSNGLCYRALRYWALAENKPKAIAYLQKYIALNLSYGLNNFSVDLEKENDLTALHHTKEWQETIRSLKDKEKKKNEAEQQKISGYKARQAAFEKLNVTGSLRVDTSISAQTLYKQLTQFNSFSKPETDNGYLFFWFPVNDSVNAPYTVSLPATYEPGRSFSLLFVLHGAVSMNKHPLYADRKIEETTGKHIATYVAKNEMIAVYPFGSPQFNWMHLEDGFHLVPGILTYLKKHLNINDNRVFITGHSNGATGAFSYMLKSPDVFGGFYGLNTQPRVRTGGTFIKNAGNRYFYSIATDKDYYYPPQAHDSINRIAKALNIDWITDMYKGYPHWFPQLDESEPAIDNIFTHLSAKQRNPFGEKLYWETDDVTYGKCDWLQITSLDTMSQQAEWHQPINFAITQWIDNQDTSKMIERREMAFQYPRKSGAVQANFRNNTFYLTTSCVKEIKLFLSPEMVDFSKPVTVYVNNKQVYRKKKSYNKSYMLSKYKQHFDRKALWVNELVVSTTEKSIIKQ